MKTVKLSGSPRENVGKKDAKEQRRQGRVPCVLYGGDKQVHFAVEEIQFKHLVFTPEAAFVEIDTDGKTYNAILQDIQYHPVSDKIIHADFLELHDDKEVTLNIPVKVTGTSKGVLRGGRLIKGTRKLPVKALPGNIPENITVDISILDIGDSIKIKDLKLENITILSNPLNTVVAVKTARTVTAEEEEEGEEAEGEGEESSEDSGDSDKPAEKSE